MSQAQITVAGITPPGIGKKQGKIQDSVGNSWNVWGDKLQNYRMGVTYDITYDTNEFNGKTFNVIKTANPANPNAQAGQVAAAPQAQQRAAQAMAAPSARDEMIFVCGIINNALANANVSPFELTPTELIDMTNKARQVWRNTLGKVQAADDMGDEIPF